MNGIAICGFKHKMVNYKTVSEYKRENYKAINKFSASMLN